MAADFEQHGLIKHLGMRILSYVYSAASLYVISTVLRFYCCLVKSSLLPLESQKRARRARQEKSTVNYTHRTAVRLTDRYIESAATALKKAAVVST
jgi:hypothetical protein